MAVRRVVLASLFGLALGCSTAADAAGRFVVRPTQVEDADLRRVARDFERNGTLQTIADDLNGMFTLPKDVGLRLMQCDEANAYYDLDAVEIQLCLELIDDMASVLEPQFEADEYADALAGAFIATALHEAGHALVDVLELPITGREEDAVDQLSAWLLIEAGEADAVLGAAATYYTDSEASDEDFADEHSLDKQRYFNHVCWVYGSAPAEYAFLLEEWELPEARADLCEDEYALLDRAWTRLLAGHLRPDSERPDVERPDTRVVEQPVGPPTRRPPPSPFNDGDEDEDENAYGDRESISDAISAGTATGGGRGAIEGTVGSDTSARSRPTAPLDDKRDE